MAIYNVGAIGVINTTTSVWFYTIIIMIKIYR